MGTMNNTTGSQNTPWMGPPSEGVVWMYRVGGSLLLTSGVIGNIMSVAVLYSLRKSRRVAYLFMLSLALSDLVINMTGVLDKWYQYVLGDGSQRLQDLNPYLCCLLHWLASSAGTVSVLLTVAVCVYEAFDTIRPYLFQGHNLNSPFGTLLFSVQMEGIYGVKLHIINIALWCIGYTSNIYIIVLVKSYTPDASREQCGYQERYFRMLATTRSWLVFTFLALLPSLVTLICTFILIAHEAIKKINSLGPRSVSHWFLALHVKMTGTILAVAVSFVVLATPISLVDLAGALYWFHVSTDLTESLHFMYFAHSAVKFYLYLLTNDEIRAETGRIFCGGRGYIGPSMFDLRSKSSVALCNSTVTSESAKSYTERETDPGFSTGC